MSFSNGEVQKDNFTIHVMRKPVAPPVAGKIAVFDPKGETAARLAAMEIEAHPVEAGGDLSGYDILVLGKGALRRTGRDRISAASATG